MLSDRLQHIASRNVRITFSTLHRVYASLHLPVCITEHISTISIRSSIVTESKREITKPFAYAEISQGMSHR